MAVTYFKRFKMEIGLEDFGQAERELPPSFRFAPWLDAQLPLHAKVKWECFRHELDATVFPCLGSKEGCLQLMKDIPVEAISSLKPLGWCFMTMKGFRFR